MVGGVVGGAVGVVVGGRRRSRRSRRSTSRSRSRSRSRRRRRKVSLQPQQHLPRVVQVNVDGLKTWRSLTFTVNSWHSHMPLRKAM